MDYIIKREDKIKELELKDLSIEEKVKELEDFDNIVLCPYEGHEIDLRKVRENDSDHRSNEYRCPECDEWIWWNTHLPWFQQAPYPINSPMIHHKEDYKCIVNPNFENPDNEPTSDEMRIWFDKNLNPIRSSTIPINPGEKAVPLSETTYVAVKEPLASH